MTQETAKERIENEIKSVEKRLHRGRNDGKTYNTGVKEGLMIARAHVVDSSATDTLSVEKLQEIRVEELKDFNSKILQAELKNQKLQKEIDAAKKYIEESYKADKEDNKLLDLIIEAVAKLKSDNETLKKALTEIYLDVNETIIDPVFLFHQSQRIAGRALNELGENNEI